MQKKAPKTLDKLDEVCAGLPEWTHGFFWETGSERATTTRLAYARELSIFFDYLTTYLPELSETHKNDITLEQFAEVTSEDVTRFIAHYKKKGCQEKALHRKRAALSSFFKYLVANRKLRDNPVSAAVKVKLHPSDEVVYLTIDEQNALMDAVYSGNKLTPHQRERHEIYRVRDMALITLMLDTGMRVAELQGIDIIDVDLEACSVVVRRKGGKIQNLYYGDTTRDLLEEYIGTRQYWDNQADGKHPLFTTTKGERLSIRAIEKLVKKYAESALPGKGKYITPHKLRSSFAMTFYGEEGDILALQRKLGHSNLQATNIYAKSTDARMKETRSVIENARRTGKK